MDSKIRHGMNRRQALVGLGAAAIATAAALPAYARLVTLPFRCFVHWETGRLTWVQFSNDDGSMRGVEDALQERALSLPPDVTGDYASVVLTSDIGVGQLLRGNVIPASPGQHWFMGVPLYSVSGVPSEWDWVGLTTAQYEWLHFRGP